MRVKKFSTPRYIDGGFSTGNYANFNLADHTGEDPLNVKNNRKLLIAKYGLAKEPKWLNQTHSNICLDDNDSTNFADSIITKKTGNPIAVLTADCLPIFAYNKDKNIIGVSHCGWRGLYAGVINNFIAKFKYHKIKPQDLIVHFATAISQKNFEVGSDFYANFITKNANYKSCFVESGYKYKFNIYQAAEINLLECGVLKENIIGCSDCSYENQNLFSYRRDGEKSGRQAHIIYLAE